MAKKDYSEDLLIQAPTAEFLDQQLGWPPMAIPNCSTYGRSNCSRQDERIMRVRA